MHDHCQKSTNPSSPFSQIMQRIAANSSEMAKNGSPVKVVAKIILEAVTNNNQIFGTCRKRCRNLGIKQEEYERN